MNQTLKSGISPKWVILTKKCQFQKCHTMWRSRIGTWYNRQSANWEWESIALTHHRPHYCNRFSIALVNEPILIAWPIDPEVIPIVSRSQEHFVLFNLLYHTNGIASHKISKPILCFGRDRRDEDNHDQEGRIDWITVLYQNPVWEVTSEKN